MKQNTANNLDTFLQSPTLGQLDREALIEIRSMARVRKYARGEFIFLQGDDMEELYLVQSGRIKLFLTTPAGKSVTYSIACAGDSLHGIALFSGEPCQSSAQAMDDVILLSIPKPDFLSFITRHPDALVHIIILLGRQVRNARHRLVDMMSQDVKQRLINTLNMLTEKFGTTIHITNEELAELAGTTTETSIRIMGQLRKARVIHTLRGKIHILDPKHLAERSTGFTVI